MPDTIAPVSRPVFHPELGDFFRELRESRQLGLRQAAKIATHKGLSALTKSTLHSLETGKTKNVDPDVFHGLAALYEIKYEALVARFIRMRYAIAWNDLIRHDSTPESVSPPSTGESDVPASERDRELSELRRQVGEYKALLGHVENAASTLATVIAAGHEIGEARVPKPKTRRRHRKAG